MELLEQILSNQNMNQAYKRVYRNKGTSGVDGISVEELKAYLREHKEELRSQIRQRKYKPQPTLRVEIPKGNGKTRQLGIPTVVDRVIQQVISQTLDFLNDGYDWLVDIDLERFFDTVHHDKLMRIVSRTIEDGDVVSLIRKYLVSGVMNNGKYEDTLIGTLKGVI